MSTAMSRSTNPLIRATVNATLGAIRRAQLTTSGILVPPITGTGKGLVPVKNSIGLGRKPKYGMRRRGICCSSTLRSLSTSNSREDSINRVIISDVHANQNAISDELMQEIARQVEIQLTKALKCYFDAPLSPDYLQQIASAQEFLNEHRNADLFQAKCLLRTMFPREYHDIIEGLKENQDPTIIYNISGGNNQIAINPNQVTQNNNDQ